MNPDNPDLASMSLEEQVALLDPANAAFIRHHMEWVASARLKQLPPEPDDQAEWLAMVDEGLDVAKFPLMATMCTHPQIPWAEYGAQAGRGFGKSRLGAEWLLKDAWQDPQALPRSVIAPTQQDVRLVCFEGESGLLSVAPPECVKNYNRSELVVTLRNDCVIRGFSAEKPERLRGPQAAGLWCFVAGTRVALGLDWLSSTVEALRPGDLVQTRSGPRRVLANSEREADVGEVGFSNGEKLVGTADHPVYTEEHGWTRMDQLRSGDTVCAINASNGAAGCGTATAGVTTSGQTSAAGQRLSGCTASVGSSRSAQYRMGTTSTTGMRTEATTALKTLSAFREAAIRGITCSRRIGSRLLLSATRWLAASVAEPVCYGASSPQSRAASTVRGAWPSRIAKPSASASSAASLSPLVPETCAASVVSTWRPTGRQSVYCLKVEGVPEYFANGILVHNCDEIAAWGKDAEDVWDMAMFGLRLGENPRIVWTSTPKPTPLVTRLTAPKPGRIIVHGSTFDNKKHLAKTFFDQLAVYDGTKLGRQELYGELIDPEEAGIIRRSQLRLWPCDQPLPSFQWIIMSLDTAFTEKTLDRKGDPDPTACGVWGVFLHEKRTNVMLLDCWEDHLGLPDLSRRVQKEMRCRYGDDIDEPMIQPMVGSRKSAGAGRTPDILLIEDKGSGISLRQTLYEQGIETYPYNPGRADKLTRLHIVSPLFAQKRVWIPESSHPERKGKPVNWAEPLIAQICAFTGEGSIRHDDHVDQTTQALRLCMDRGLLPLVKPAEERSGYEPPPPRRGGGTNPYAA